MGLLINGQVGWRSATVINPSQASSLWTSVYAVYNADAVGSSSLKTSLFAAYNGESNANDSFGSNNGTAQGGLTYGTGKIGNAFQFNGTTSYINHSTDAFKFTSNYSVSFWYNTSSTSFQSLISCYSNAGGKRGWAIQNTGTAINFKTFKDNATYSDLNYTISTNTWYHVSVVRKSGVSSKIYLNGALVASDSVTTDQNYLSNFSLIGAINDNGTLYNYTSGKVDALNIWNKELTQSEITELYNSGNGTQYIGDNFYKPTTNDALNTYNGTPQGGLTYGVGKVGTAFQFNGSNAYVSMANNSMNLTGDFSISMWVYLTGFPSEQIPISNFYEPSPAAGNSRGWMIYMSGQNLYWIVCGSSQVNLITSISSFQNTWKQITITYKNGVGSKIYFDGVLVTSNSSSVSPIYNSTQTPFIGKYQYGNGSSFGYMPNGSKVDALNVWNRELTATDVTELYNAGAGKQYPN